MKRVALSTCCWYSFEQLLNDFYHEKQANVLAFEKRGEL